jgi:hypothetical protein
MQGMNARLARLLSLSLLVVAAALPALAATTYTYGTQSGSNFDFVGTQETVQTADDESAPLFEAPTVIGNQLVFSPDSFLADSSGGVGGIDETHSTLETTITSTAPGAYIQQILISEGGDIILGAFPPTAGTDATGGMATMSGTVQILAALNTSVIGNIVTFGGGDFDTIFTGEGGGVNFIYRGLDTAPLPRIGSTGWTGSVDIDLDALFPGAGITSAILKFNNYLAANSEAGTSALIQKKAVDGPKVTVIPEPGTAALVLCGLLGMAARRSRARRD